MTPSAGFRDWGLVGWCLTPLDNKFHPFKRQHMIKGSQTPDQCKVKLGPVMMLLTIDQCQTEGQT